MLRLVAVWECIDRRGALLVGAPINERGARLVQADCALELFKGRYKQDVCEPSGVSRTRLKAILAEDDPTIGSHVFNDPFQRQDIFFLYVTLPQLTLNDPAAFDAVMAKYYIHINFVGCTGTCYLSLDAGRAAYFSEESRHGFLICAPISID
jgi:hypothetical protein